MYHMKTASIRDLRYDFKKVERMLSQGNVVEITKRRKVVAHLTPVPSERPPLPDFLARLKEIYGDKVLEVSGADLISADREDRF
jgi:antitoxin (DNA-binding transcriptional repressor) of toxin-antitoxin stability system